MLGELARHSALPVPAVHVALPDLLAMDFIETDGGGITPAVERHAAELIAALHATPRPFFGYERDTLIGPLPQPNPRSERWIPFFARAQASRHGARGGSGRCAAGEAPHQARASGRAASRLSHRAALTPACCTAISGQGTCSCAATGLPASSIRRSITVTRRSSSPLPPYSGHSAPRSSKPTKSCAARSRIPRHSVRIVQTLPDARACAAVRRGVYPADRADLVACRIVVFRKKNRPGDPGPVFPAKRAELQRHCLLDGLWLAPPFFS